MDQALQKKLLLKPGYRVLMLNAPEGYLERLSPLPEGAIFVDAGPADWVQIFMRNKGDVSALGPKGIAAVKRDGVLWLSYMKGGPKVTDINRDKGWDALVDAGWGGVTQVAIDDNWSALRFRPEADVQRKGAPPQLKR